jgi:dipeptidyl aminopeptidase/acylaminoacyl peptidase
MTSAYGGIRWASGLARAFQYERTQSRIGGSIWEYPLRFLENSPLFHADRIETPLLMMHNDNDGAVPWYQGIEMFVAMRRLGKEVYMVNYNGDEHNPTKRANQADIAKKTMEFFDHHLRGKPMPQWMVEGIPYLEKGRR